MLHIPQGYYSTCVQLESLGDLLCFFLLLLLWTNQEAQCALNPANFISNDFTLKAKTQLTPVQFKSRLFDKCEHKGAGHSTNEVCVPV